MSPSENVEPGLSAVPAKNQPSWLDLNDAAFLEQCRFEAFRGPGPGGQKRNKTSNSIRLTHVPTGIHVMAGESRSQSENKLRAVRRLKVRIAADIRHPVDSRGFEPPPWFASVVQLGRIAASHRNEHYARAGALLLDLLEARNGNVADVAGLLGTSTSSTIKFLAGEPEWWTVVNSIRRRSGLRPLQTRES